MRHTRICQLLVDGRGPTDLRSETSDPSLAWRLDPALQSVSQFGLVTLAPTTQRAMEKLWKLGWGTISIRNALTIPSVRDSPP